MIGLNWLWYELWENLYSFIILIPSGCWELNPAFTHPKRAYDRYTTARPEGMRIIWYQYLIVRLGHYTIFYLV